MMVRKLPGSIPQRLENGGLLESLVRQPHEANLDEMIEAIELSKNGGNPRLAVLTMPITDAMIWRPFTEALGQTDSEGLLVPGIELNMPQHSCLVYIKGEVVLRREPPYDFIDVWKALGAVSLRAK